MHIHQKCYGTLQNTMMMQILPYHSDFQHFGYNKNKPDKTYEKYS